jgi:hypothetical protein
VARNDVWQDSEGDGKEAVAETLQGTVRTGRKTSKRRSGIYTLLGTGGQK